LGHSQFSLPDCLVAVSRGVSAWAHFGSGLCSKVYQAVLYGHLLLWPMTRWKRGQTPPLVPYHRAARGALSRVVMVQIRTTDTASVLGL
jgi:hypothetical protein